MSFYATNFLFLSILLFMVYKIRHIEDDTKIKAECATIVGVWLFLSIFQYAIFVTDNIQGCNTNVDNGWNDSTIYQLTYWSIILRDYLTMLITLGFQIWVARNQDTMLSTVLSTGGHDATLALQDFDMLIESVLPHKQFTEFLRQEKPDMLPFIVIIRKTKLLREMQDNLEQITYTSSSQSEIGRHYS